MRKAALPLLAVALAGGTAAAGGARTMAAQSPFQWSTLTASASTSNSTPGMLTIHRGQTASAFATFTSNVALSNVQVVRGSGDPTGDRGVSFTVVSPSAASPSVAAHTTTTVMLSIAAQPTADLGIHKEQVFLKVGLNGGASFHQGPDLDFKVNVLPAVPPRITWSLPGNSFGTLNIPQGTTVYKTIQFISDQDLTNVQVVRGNFDRLGDRGVFASTVTPTATLSSLAARTPMTVVLAIHVQANAALGLHGEQEFVKAGTFGHLEGDLDFNVNVLPAAAPPQSAAVPPRISWMLPDNSFGTLNIPQGTTVYKTVQFTSDQNLTNVQVVRGNFDRLGDRGVFASTVVPNTMLPSLAAHTPVIVLLAIHVQANAALGLHGEQEFVKAGTFGHLQGDLDFRVNVLPGVRSQVTPPTPLISWSAPDNSFGTLTVRRGTTMYESVQFTSDQNLTNVQVVRGSFDRLGDRGVFASTVTPTATLPNVAAHTPVTVVLAIHVQANAALGLHGEQEFVKAGTFGHLEGDLDFRVNVVS